MAPAFPVLGLCTRHQETPGGRGGSWPIDGSADAALARTGLTAFSRCAVNPGDLERAGERALLASGAALQADLLLLPHHGSRTSSTAGFLAAVSPRVAIASAPCLGRYEMPARDVAARVRARGATLLWTGRDGALGATLAPGAPIRAWRSAPLEFCGSR